MSAEGVSTSSCAPVGAPVPQLQPLRGLHGAGALTSFSPPPSEDVRLPPAGILVAHEKFLGVSKPPPSPWQTVGAVIQGPAVVGGCCRACLCGHGWAICWRFVSKHHSLLVGLAVNQQLVTVSDQLWGERYPWSHSNRGHGWPCSGAAEELRCSNSSSGVSWAGSQNRPYISVV